MSRCRYPARPVHIYNVSEDDLRKLADGSSEGQVYFDLGCVFGPIGLTGIAALFTLEGTKLWPLVFFMVLSVFGVGLGVVFFLLWYSLNKKKTPLLDAILATPISGPMGHDLQVAAAVEKSQHDRHTP